MSRLTADSDYDYQEEVERGDFRNVIKRTCTKCAHPFYVSIEEPFQMDPWCDACCQDFEMRRDRLEALRQAVHLSQGRRKRA